MRVGILAVASLLACSRSDLVPADMGGAAAGSGGSAGMDAETSAGGNGGAGRVGTGGRAGAPQAGTDGRAGASHEGTGGATPAGAGGATPAGAGGDGGNAVEPGAGSGGAPAGASGMGGAGHAAQGSIVAGAGGQGGTGGIDCGAATTWTVPPGSCLICELEDDPPCRDYDGGTGEYCAYAASFEWCSQPGHYSPRICLRSCGLCTPKVPNEPDPFDREAVFCVVYESDRRCDMQCTPSLVRNGDTQGTPVTITYPESAHCALHDRASAPCVDALGEPQE
jgi:hypothetical protein